MKRSHALAILATVLLLAGCGGKTASASTASPSSSPSPAFTVPTKSFSSAALGVSFRYPASWRAATPGVVKDGSGTVTFRGPSGEVSAWVVFLPPAKHAAPLSFGDADSADLSEQRSSTDDKILQSGLVTVDRLRLVEIDSIGEAEPGQVPWICDQLSSAGMGGNPDTLHASLLGLDVACPSSQWPAQRTTLLDVLTSMRFTRPKG